MRALRLIIPGAVITAAAFLPYAAAFAGAGGGTAQLRGDDNRSASKRLELPPKPGRRPVTKKDPCRSCWILM